MHIRLHAVCIQGWCSRGTILLCALRDPWLRLLRSVTDKQQQPDTLPSVSSVAIMTFFLPSER